MWICDQFALSLTLGDAYFIRYAPSPQRDTTTALAECALSECSLLLLLLLFTSDNGGGICFRTCARVRLSVCVQDYSKTRAWM